MLSSLPVSNRIYTSSAQAKIIEITNKCIQVIVEKYKLDSGNNKITSHHDIFGPIILKLVKTSGIALLAMPEGLMYTHSGTLKNSIPVFPKKFYTTFTSYLPSQVDQLLKDENNRDKLIEQAFLTSIKITLEPICKEIIQLNLLHYLREQCRRWVKEISGYYQYGHLFQFLIATEDLQTFTVVNLEKINHILFEPEYDPQRVGELYKNKTTGLLRLIFKLDDADFNLAKIQIADKPLKGSRNNSCTSKDKAKENVNTRIHIDSSLVDMSTIYPQPLSSNERRSYASTDSKASQTSATRPKGFSLDQLDLSRPTGPSYNEFIASIQAWHQEERKNNSETYDQIRTFFGTSYELQLLLFLEKLIAQFNILIPAEEQLTADSRLPQDNAITVKQQDEKNLTTFPTAITAAIELKSAEQLAKQYHFSHAIYTKDGKKELRKLAAKCLVCIEQKLFSLLANTNKENDANGNITNNGLNNPTYTEEMRTKQLANLFDYLKIHDVTDLCYGRIYYAHVALITPANSDVEMYFLTEIAKQIDLENPVITLDLFKQAATNLVKKVINDNLTHYITHLGTSKSDSKTTKRTVAEQLKNFYSATAEERQSLSICHTQSINQQASSTQETTTEIAARLSTVRGTFSSSIAWGLFPSSEGQKCFSFMNQMTRQFGDLVTPINELTQITDANQLYLSSYIQTSGIT